MPYKSLIACDEPDTLGICSKILKREGFDVSTVKDGIEAIKMIEKEPFDLLLLDIRMPGKNGMEVLDVATTNSLDTIMITAYATVGTAVEAMKKGAKDYLTKTFSPIYCGSIPESLLESELFGHTKGAFTGSVDSKPGLFEAASEGSVFLDEIAEMSPALQVKLLRIIQDKEIRRVGAIELKRINIRIIAATNKELSREAFAGRFREDLFYRLSVISLRLPPLRERKEDIPLLVHHFIRKFNRLYSREIVGVAPP